jgi:hypothetical protein
MSRRLPAQPNIEFLKKEAKELLDSQRPQHPEWKLADAQHALAREYGFDSWPKLKASVESLMQPSPLAGRWVANISKSKRNPSNLFRRATIDVSVAGNTVRFAHDAIDEVGREDRDVNTVEADGIERVHAHGYRLTVRWMGAHVLEIMTTHAGLPASCATYEVSPDGRTLIVSTIDQRLVFERSGG